MIGHNNPPIETAADLPDGMPKMHFFKCDIAALRKATIDKPLDIRGAYLAVLLAMYEHMEPLPADDHMAMMRTGIRDARVWRRVKGELIKLGLVQVRASGRLTNSRFEEEITSYVVEFRNRQKAAIEREQKARVARTTKAPKAAQNEKIGSSSAVVSPQLAASYAVASPQLQPSSALTNSELSRSNGKNPNEINGASTTTVPEPSPRANHESRIRARDLEIELDSRGRKEDTPLPPKGGGAGYWGNALNPNLDYGVEVAGDGSIKLVNGSYQRWLEEFGGDQKSLDLALGTISIQRNSREGLRKQVERQLSRIALQRRDSDRRYHQSKTERIAAQPTSKGRHGTRRTSGAEFLEAAQRIEAGDEPIEADFKVINP